MTVGGLAEKKPDNAIAVQIPFMRAEAACSEIAAKGRYRFIESLQYGGAREVFLVEDLALDNAKLVLKILKQPAANGPRLNTLRTEFTTLARMRHPNLVKVHDFSKIPGNGDYYFTMEYVEGVEFLQAIAGCTAHEIIDLILQILHALDYIHSSGVCHGDLKSENILVAQEEGVPEQIKLMDFGLSSPTAASGRNAARGTVAYMAPELFKGAAPSIQSDLYAIGVLMYWALTGRAPFTGSPSQIRNGHLRSRPARASELVSSIDRNIESVITRLLAKDPIQRFASSNQVIGALDTKNRTSIYSFYIVASRLRDAFIRIHSHRIKTWVSRMTAALQDETDDPWKKPVYYQVSGRKGSGHHHIFDEIRLQLQLKEIKCCEARFRQDLSSPGEPLVNAFNGYPDVQSILQQIYSLDPEPRQGRISPEQDLSRMRKYDELTQTLAAHCANGPIVLLLSDIQFADEGTLELIFYLARALEGSKIALCGSLAADSLGEMSSKIVTRARNSLRSRREMEIKPLNGHEMTLLLEHAFDRFSRPVDFDERLTAQSGGLFTLAMALIMDLYQSGYLRRSGDCYNLGDDYVFNLDSLKALHAQTLKAMGRKHKKVIQNLAVCQGPVSLELLARLTGLRKPLLSAACAELANRRILRSHKGTGYEKFTIRDDSFQQVVYEKIAVSRRRLLHGKICDSADQFPLSPEQKAHHFLMAGRVERAFRYSAQAIRHLRRIGANQRALQLAENAFALSVKRRRCCRRTLLRRMAEIHESQGKLQTALSEYKRLYRSYRSGVARSAVYRRMSSIQQKLGQFDKADALLTRALSILSDKAAVEKALIIRERAWIASQQGDYGRSIELAQSVIEILRENAPLAYGKTLNNLGVTHFFNGNLDKAVACFLKSAGVKQKLGDYYGTASALNNLGNIVNMTGDHRTAKSYLQSSLKIRKEIGDMSGIAQSLGNLGIILLEEGDYTTSFNFYCRSLDLRKRIGDIRGMATVYGNLAELEYMRDNYSRALFYCQEGLICAAKSKSMIHRAELLYQQSRIYLVMNQRELAEKSIDLCLNLAEGASPKSKCGVYTIQKCRAARDLDEESRERLLKMAEAVAKLESDNVLELELLTEHLSMALARGQYKEVQERIESRPRFESSSHQWYQLRIDLLHLTAGLNGSGPYEDLKDKLARTEKRAEKQGLYSILKNINYFQGRYLERRGERRAAYLHWRKAYQCLKLISSRIVQDEYRKSYLNLPENRILLNSLKKLQIDLLTY